MFVLVRALTFASVFVALVLVLAPARAKRPTLPLGRTVRSPSGFM